MLFDKSLFFPPRELNLPMLTPLLFSRFCKWSFMPGRVNSWAPLFLVVPNLSFLSLFFYYSLISTMLFYMRIKCAS